MELKELFDLHEKLETRINAYWTYWSVAVFAFGGWLFTGKHSFTFEQSAAVSFGALVFFFCNLGVLWQSTKLVTAVRDEIRIKSGETSFKSTNLQRVLSEDGLKYRLKITIILHIVVDLIVVWALFSIG